MSKTSHKSMAVASFIHKKYEETTTPNRPNPITIITRFIFQGTDGPKPATSTAGLSRTGSGGPAKARRKASETSDWLKPFWKRKSSLSLVGWSVFIWIQEIKWTHVYIYIYTFYLSENLGKWLKSSWITSLSSRKPTYPHRVAASWNSSPPHLANDGMYMRMQCHGTAIQLLRPRSLVKKFTAAATWSSRNAMAKKGAVIL